MLILLPASEGKAERGSGAPYGPLSFPALDRSRERVINALLKVSRRRDALDVLGLTPGLAGELDKNLAVRTAPALPAGELYTGVLYDNLGLATLPDEAGKRAEESVLVFSGLWGVLRVTDRVPPYRLSMGVKLPPLGGLAAFWRPAVSKELDQLPGLVVDMRSSAFAGAWRPGARAVGVRVLRGGKVVSHMAKATRGVIARTLLEAGVDPGTPHELAEMLGELGHDVSLSEPPRAGQAWTIDVHVS